MDRSKAQKEADKRYSEKIKGKYKKFSTDLPAEEVDAISALLEERGFTKAEFIRKAVESLKKLI
jgi:hypothetical protein